MTGLAGPQPPTPVDYWDAGDATPKGTGTRAANVIRIVQTVLFVIVAGFFVSVVVAGHWWQKPPPITPPPPAVNVAEVGSQVVELLRSQWDSGDLQEYGVTLDDSVTLINTSLNKYDGLATVHTRKGTQKFLAVNVWADPTGAMFYNMDVSSASSLIEAIKKEEPSRCWGGC